LIPTKRNYVEHKSVAEMLLLPQHQPEHLDGCVYYKKDDRWIKETFNQTRRTAKFLACALQDLGHERGDRIGILSRSRLEWSLADLGILAAAMVTVGIYETSTAKQCAYIINHAQIETCFVEDSDQTEKLLSESESMPTLKRIVQFQDEPKPGHAERIELTTYPKLVQHGREVDEKSPELFDKTIHSIGPQDIATIVYTSGTTGDPKGVVLDHKTIMAVMKSTLEAVPLEREYLGLVFLPLAHILQRASNYIGLQVGMEGAFAESIDKLVDNLQELKPNTFSAVPRIYEKIHARVLAEVSRANPRRQAIFNWALNVGMRYSKLVRENKPVGLTLGLQRNLAERLVYKKIQQVFGGNVSFMISGGAPISQEILEFFDAFGLRILEGYGLTETVAPLAVNRPDNRRFGTVGLPLSSVEVKIADDGEICVKGESIFGEYYKDPEATKEAFDDDGFFKTGDIGDLDKDGFLRVTDRKKDLIVTAGGKNIAPQPIENALKSTGYISQAVVVGDKRKFISALIALDEDEIQNWARQQKIEDRAELATHPKLTGFVDDLVKKVNANLPRYEQIKKFKILHRELTIEDGEITPTQKVKRAFVNQRYKALIDDMYQD